VLEVAHGGSGTEVHGARAYDDALDDPSTPERPARTPSGDDQIFIYTGGTTGMASNDASRW